MKVGLQIIRFENPGGAAALAGWLSAVARTADDAGFASLWVMDHFFQMEFLSQARAEDMMLEGYSALHFLAAQTKQVRLGTMVTGVNYRDPGYLLKVVTALDVLSGGRAWLGIGAGWYEREARGLGMPFPPLKERFERLEETLQLVTRVWAGDFSPHHGKHYTLAEPVNNPGPLSKPHPPILIGGGGEQKTLRMVAQYADACNLFAPIGEEALRQKLAVLQQHCAALGRDYATVERTALVNVKTSADGSIDVPATIEHCRALAALGIQQAIFSDVPEVYAVKNVERIASEILPAVAAF